jgi:hypothetical protein
MPQWFITEMIWAWRDKDVDYIIELNRQWYSVLNANSNEDKE